jgi:hypothetical protein
MHGMVLAPTGKRENLLFFFKLPVFLLLRFPVVSFIIFKIHQKPFLLLQKVFRF